jgi:purine-binding chemotaxis protein CheW
MTKKRIRYSEFGTTPEKVVEPAAPVEPSVPIAPRAAVDFPIVDHVDTAVLVAEAPVAPRPRRNSTPVELARALAAAQLLEAATAAKEAEQEAAKDTTRPAPVPAPTKNDLAEVLVFRIGHERFAVDLLAVEEVIDLPVIHFVPEMAPAMVGVVNVRDSLTPVFTPNAALGLPVAASEAVLIFRRAVGRIGVLIDDVEDAITIDLRELRRAPENDADDNVVLGVIRHDATMFALVDADALIAACQTAALLETA